MAELAFWFHFQPTELWEMELEDIENWLNQAERQAKAQYKSLL